MPDFLPLPGAADQGARGRSSALSRSPFVPRKRTDLAARQSRTSQSMGPLRSTTTDAATTIEAVFAIFKQARTTTMNFQRERSFHGQPLPHHIDHQAGAD